MQATVAVATLVSGAWWVDPAGGIAISLFILWRWYEIAKNQVDKIVGRGAPDELLVQLRQVRGSWGSCMFLASRALHYMPWC